MSQEKISEYEERIKKLDDLKKAGIDPYPAKTGRTHEIAPVLSDFTALEQGREKICVAGRLRGKRGHGNLTFGHLEDGTGKIQIAFSKKEIGADSYKLFGKYADTGDFIEVSGICFTTQKREKSIMAGEWRMLAKALRPLPDKWSGLKDEEERLRKRYLDILFDQELKDLIEKKAKFWEVTRQFMKKRGFLEVETPTLEVTTGGAEANPFRTYHQDYGLDVCLRISVGELWQKKLMAAGLEKTFEIGRVYRNEGSSPDHLQEFTNMEFYWAFADYRDGMKLGRELYLEIARQVFGKTKFTTKGHNYDLADEWRKIDYREEILRQTGVDVAAASENDMKKKLKELGVAYKGETRERLMDTLWKYCRKSISGPAFLVAHPKLVSPLAKEMADRPGFTERFQIIIAGSEIGNGYSELNDPREQRQRFEIQQKLIEAGDKEAMMPDWEFVEMLDHGMPPTCGFGFGERLFAFFMDKPVREATLFPLVKPKNS